MSPTDLTPKQMAFVNAYLANGHNASAAYREAYACSRTWKPTTLWVEASRLMDNPKVSLLIGTACEPPTKEWARAKLRYITEICLNPDHQDLPTARATIQTLAQMEGWIETGKGGKPKDFDMTMFARLKPAAAKAMLEQKLAELSEMDRAELAGAGGGTVITLPAGPEEKTE